uniref:Uncharacterized protein n=1 Tax=Ixodes ricinus TaxID=34613 RepID=V5I078_IXORI
MATRHLKSLVSTSIKFRPIKLIPTMSTTRCLSEQSFQVEHDEANREFFNQNLEKTRLSFSTKSSIPKPWT